jgi:hypothetical protein
VLKRICGEFAAIVTGPRRFSYFREFFLTIRFGLAILRRLKVLSTGIAREGLEFVFANPTFGGITCSLLELVGYSNFSEL